MKTETQSLILAQIAEELDEAKKIVMREPTQPSDIGRSDSATCRLWGLIEKSRDWLNALREELP